MENRIPRHLEIGISDYFRESDDRIQFLSGEAKLSGPGFVFY
jgi:hypothetical protein